MESDRPLNLSDPLKCLLSYLCPPTSHAVPKAQPDDVDVVALGDGSVRVGWKPLSLTESRGFPLYIVSYTSDDGAALGSVNTTNSSVIITGLNPNIGYSFTVQVATEIGNGPARISKLFPECVHCLSLHVPSAHVSSKHIQ